MPCPPGVRRRRRARGYVPGVTATASHVPLRMAAAALFLVSGAAGLVYEVAWARLLVRIVGGAYPAAAAVAAAFLGGLALGAHLGSKWAVRTERPLRLYAILEGCIAAWALLFPLLLAAAHPVHGWCYRAFGGQPALHMASNFVVAAALLLPPTIAMGATLPVLLRPLAGGGGTVLGGTGLLYGINTAGAAAGAAAAGFALLPALGIRGTVLAAAGANALVAAIALLLDRRAGPMAAAAAPPPPKATVPAASPAPATGSAIPLLVAAAASGFAALAFQMAWTRVLVLCFGSSVHAFTLVLAVFVLGLGLGGLAAPLVGGRVPGRAARLAILWGVAAFLAWRTVSILAELPLVTALELTAHQGDYGAALEWQAGVVFRLVLPATLAMGAAFPVLVAAVAEASGADGPRAAGRVYAWNTVGAILGSLAGGVLLVPAIGLRGTLLLATIVLFSAAAIAASRIATRRVWVRAAAAVGLLALGAGLANAAPEWPRERLSSGPWIYGARYVGHAKVQSRSPDRVIRGAAWDMPYFSEGQSGVIAVLRGAEGMLQLRINGKTDAGTGFDMETQLLLGHLPALAHPAPKTALVVGLATGVTANAVSSHGLERVDVLEISPEVAEACRVFDQVNDGVLDRPSTRVILEDGRKHAEHARETYDLLVSEPTNPWIAGVSDLFTEEYFRACRARLNRGGVFGAWLQSYFLAEEDFRMVIRTARSVFPNLTVWECVPYQDYLLLGCADDASDPAAMVAARGRPGEKAAADLARAGISDPAAVLSRLWLGREATARYAGEGPLHTDDRLQLEFRAPRGVFGDRGYPLIRPEDLERARPDPPAALSVPVGDRAALEKAVAARVRLLRTLPRLEALQKEEDVVPRLRALVADLPRLRAIAAKAPPPIRSAVLEKPDGPWSAPVSIGILLTEDLIDLEGAMEDFPGDRGPAVLTAIAHGMRGEALMALGSLGDGERDFLRAAKIGHAPAGAWLRVGRARAEAGHGDPTSPSLGHAIEALDEAIKLHSNYEDARVLRGEILGLQGRDAEAEKELEHMLRLRPDSVRALDALARLRHRQGRREEAHRLASIGLAHEPDDKRLTWIYKETRPR